MKIVVTGGSRGIGKSIVLNAVKLGYDVAFTYNEYEEGAQSVLKEARAINPTAQCRYYQLDIKSEKRIESVTDQILNDFETVDALVCNAGINKNNLAFTMSDEEWHEVIATNLTSAFYFSRHYLPIFLSNKFGRFVFLSSIAKDGIPGQINYAASKAGLIGLSGTLAKEYGAKGILSNVVVPGFIDTDMTEKTMSSYLKDFWNELCPLKRIGRSDEVAAMVLFLITREASFVNGQVLNVTGGMDWCC